MSAPTLQSDVAAGRFDVDNLCELFQRTAAERGDAVALRSLDGATVVTWSEYAAAVRELAAGLAGLGVGHGGTVALMMGNRPEFHLLDAATLHLGATSFSIYETFPIDAIAHVLANSGATVVVCDQRHLDAVLAACEEAGVAEVVCVDGGDPRGLALDELKAEAPDDFDFEAAWRAVGADDVATLIYTSGTTGPPKGVELTHGNVLAELRATAAVLEVRPGDRAISSLPMAHAAERWATHYQGFAYGLEVTCVADLKQLAAALVQVRPNVWGSVPRVWERLYRALQAAPAGDPELLRERVGLDQVRWTVVGAAPTPPHVFDFFVALGVPICELWGMSELTCVATCSPPGESVPTGSVGRALPGVEIRLADDGEIEVRGPIVMRGYRGEPAKTAEVMTADGFLRTGDIGRIDDGFLWIVDRKKELIINASGKNMSPANIEAALKPETALIAHVVAIGDGRPYVTALIALDPDEAAAYAGPSDLRLIAELQQAVDRANAKLARVEHVRRFAVVADVWEPGSELLTPTMKLKRRGIAERYAHEIEELYE